MNESQSIQALRDDLADIKARIERIDHAVRGNGRPGLNTRVAILERFRDGASRLVWLVIGSAVAAVCSAGAALAHAVMGGGQ